MAKQAQNILAKIEKAKEGEKDELKISPEVKAKDEISENHEKEEEKISEAAPF